MGCGGRNVGVDRPSRVQEKERKPTARGQAAAHGSFRGRRPPQDKPRKGALRYSASLAMVAVVL